MATHVGTSSLLSASLAALALIAVHQATTFGAAGAVEKARPQRDECTDSLVESVANKCRQLSTVGADSAPSWSLENFLEFHGIYTEFAAKCLQKKSTTLKVSGASETAESICQQNGYQFDQMRPLAHQVEQMLVLREPVCTIEFAAKLANFHRSQRLDKSGDSLLERTFRLFANSVAHRCRSSLAKRLVEVEQRAPDSVKFVQLINAVTKINLGKYQPLDAESFVPILERELTQSLFDPELSSIGRNGFEFRASSQVVKLSLDSLRMACNSLRLYQMNLFGSLGLLASLGYASPAVSYRFKWRQQQQQQQSSTAADSPQPIEAQIQRWLMSAFVCQSLRNVIKLSSVNGSDGKLLTRVKVLQTQEADVSLEDEQDKMFATFQLPEDSEDDQEQQQQQRAGGAGTTAATQVGLIDSLANFKFSDDDERRMNSRKLQLLNGPNYKLASAIYNFLDLSQPKDRLEIIETLVGSKLIEVGGAEMSNNEEEEEEEEEE